MEEFHDGMGNPREEAGDTLAPGWDAITAALDMLYPGVEPRHFGTLIRFRLGGPDPLDGLSAYKRLEPVPHWHIVSYGLSELYEKESDDSETSGYGFELTFRLTCDPAEEEPPMWAMNFLQNLARYVFDTGNVFRVGDWMPANGPISRDHETKLHAVAFTADPELPAIATPFGRVEFRQVVGLTDDELRAARMWRTSSLLDAFRPHLPLLVTGLARGSMLAEPALARAVAEGSARDGSSTGYLLTDRLDWTVQRRWLGATRYEVTLGACQVEELAGLLPLRLPFERSLRLADDDGVSVVFAPGARDEVAEEDGALVLRLTPVSARALAEALHPMAGSYAVPGLPAVTLLVEDQRTV